MNAASAPAPITTDAELKLLQALIYRECGMHFDARREHFLQNRLQRRLKECQIESFYSYYRLLTSPEGRDELALLLERLTVNETSFFRNRAQLDLFSELLAQRLRETLNRCQRRGIACCFRDCHSDAESTCDCRPSRMVRPVSSSAWTNG